MEITLTITGANAAEIKEAVAELSTSYAVSAKGELLELKTKEAVEENEIKAPQPEKAPEPQLAGKQVGLSEIRGLIAEKAKTHRDEIRTMLETLGYSKITELKPEQYEAFYLGLKSL